MTCHEVRFRSSSWKVTTLRHESTTRCARLLFRTEGVQRYMYQLRTPLATRVTFVTPSQILRGDTEPAKGRRLQTPQEGGLTISSWGTTRPAGSGKAPNKNAQPSLCFQAMVFVSRITGLAYAIIPEEIRKEDNKPEDRPATSVSTPSGFPLPPSHRPSFLSIVPTNPLLEPCRLPNSALGQAT